MSKDKSESWGSYSGFIFAVIGSAVGLGNIWRFPYIVGTNGGGAFLLPYIIVMFTFGLAFMILELAIGRYYQRSVVTSLESIRKRFRWIGVFIISIAFSILSYYIVLVGWILFYFFSLLIGLEMRFGSFTGSWYPLLSFLVIVIINYLIIRAGVRNGIEVLNKVGILLLIAILIPLTIISLSLDGAEKGIEFYLTPNFSVLSDPATWSAAYGQVFFSSSIGIGILLTYGSYMNEKRSLLSSSILIMIANLLFSFTAGLMIFAIVFSFGIDPAEGILLIFVAMPSIFSNMEFGMIIGALFFFILFIAGLTSSISIFEVPVASLKDLGFNRDRSALLITLLLLLVGLPSALSYTPLNLKLFGVPFLDLMDSVFGTFGIAISAAILVIVITWFIPKERIMEEVNLNSINIPAWTLMLVKIVAPILIIATIVAEVIEAL